MNHFSRINNDKVFGKIVIKIVMSNSNIILNYSTLDFYNLSQ